MKDLWDDSYGKIGAVLKILGRHGVTREELELIRQNPDGMGQGVAQFILLRAATECIVFEGHFSSCANDTAVIARHCHFVNTDTLGDLDTEDMNGAIARAVSDWPNTICVFRFKSFQFDGIAPFGRLPEIERRMKLAGCVPAPFRLFLMYIRDRVQQNSSEMMQWRTSPLTCLDRQVAEGFNFLSVANRSYSPFKPQLEVGTFGLTAPEGNPSVPLYLGIKTAR